MKLFLQQGLGVFGAYLLSKVGQQSMASRLLIGTTLSTAEAASRWTVVPKCAAPPARPKSRRLRVCRRAERDDPSCVPIVRASEGRPASGADLIELEFASQFVELEHDLEVMPEIVMPAGSVGAVLREEDGQFCVMWPDLGPPTWLSPRDLRPSSREDWERAGGRV